MGFRLSSHAKMLLALAGVFILTLFTTTQGAIQDLILEGRGTAEENATLKLFIYNSSTALVPILTTAVRAENGSWNVTISSDRLSYDRIYWVDYRVNGKDVDWGIRERKPLLIHESRVVQFLGSWLWEVQVIVDLMRKRLAELDFIKVYPSHAYFSLPIAFMDGPTVYNVTYDPSSFGDMDNHSLVNQYYVDYLIEALPTTFLELEDTPSTYAGKEGYYVRVNDEGTGLEFARVPSGGGGGALPPTVGVGEVAYGGEDGSITSNPAFVYNGTLGVNKTLAEVSNSIYTLDVGGYANAEPSCIKMVLAKDYFAEAKTWKDMLPFNEVFIVEDNSNPLIFSPEKEGLHILEPGYYEISGVVDVAKVELFGGFGVRFNGILKGPFHISSDGSHAYTYLVKLDRDTYLTFAVNGVYVILSRNPSLLGTEEYTTWFYVCRIN